MAHGLLELHKATGDPRWLEEDRLARLAIDLFADEERGGFYLSAADAEQLVARQAGPRGPADPGRQLDARLRAAQLARIYGDDEPEKLAVGVFRLIREAPRALRSASASRWPSTCISRRRGS